MNLNRQTWTLLLAAMLLTIVSGCVTQPQGAEQAGWGSGLSVARPQRADSSRGHITVLQAQNSLAEALGHLRNLKSVREVKFLRDKVTFLGDSVEDRMPKSCFVSLSGMENLSVASGLYSTFLATRQWLTRVVANGKPLSLGGVDAWFDTEHDARLFIDSLLTLRKAALTTDTEETDFATFTASAKTWLAATPRPAMPDDARAYKALAEDAFEKKDFTGALDAYCKALDKYPMWSNGQYSAAILAAEAEDYELAAHHMRRYLVLSPDAKDARAAKDKLLLWQLKAKE